MSQDQSEGRMLRVHIIGRKNSGKTTLIVDVVQELSGRGLKVGTIKHTHHHHELDTPGKDSCLHRQVGATLVGILSPGMDAVFRPRRPGSQSDDRYATFEPLFSDCDVVLVEGDSQTTGIKIEVWREVSGERPLADDDNSIVAVVTDDALESTSALWPRADVPAIAGRILKLAQGE